MAARIWGVVGVGAVGLASVGIAAPAGAAEVPGCGEEPIGGTLTNLGSVCEVDFSTVGEFSWTVPAGITGLAALLVGGGGGAIVDSTANTGYAGAGGDVIYADVGTVAAGTSVVIEVGAGGNRSTSSAGPTAGGDTTVDLVGGITAVGGDGGTATPGCGITGAYVAYVGTGAGAGGAATDDGIAECDDVFGPGVNPSEADVDSDAQPVPTIFSTLAREFGTGGRVLADIAFPTDSDIAGTGQGANIEVTANAVQGANAVGGSGRVVFRFPTLALPEAPSGESGAGVAAAGTSSAALPDTGVATSGPIGLVAFATILGSLMLLASRRRRRGAETE